MRKCFVCFCHTMGIFSLLHSSSAPTGSASSSSSPPPPENDASLTISGELRGSSSVVTVRWANVQPPVGGWAASNATGERRDWIGIYENASWPNEGNPAFSDYLPRYCPPCVGSDSSVWEVWRLDPLHFGSGSGEANFTLFNTRYFLCSARGLSHR